MAKLIRFDSAAREEFDEAFNWYATRSHGAAVGFAAEVDQALEEILQSPERFAKTYAGCQYHRLNRYPYSIVFYHKENCVTIVAIAHAKRKPGFWRTRL